LGGVFIGFDFTRDLEFQQNQGKVGELNRSRGLKDGLDVTSYMYNRLEAGSTIKLASRQTGCKNKHNQRKKRKTIASKREEKKNRINFDLESYDDNEQMPFHAMMALIAEVS